MATITIHGGDFLPGSSQYSAGDSHLLLKTTTNCTVGEYISRHKITGCDIVTQESKRAGWHGGRCRSRCSC